MMRTLLAVAAMSTASLGSAHITASEPLQVSVDFPSGSGEVLAIDQEKRAIAIRPTPHVDRGWACWWYVKIDGIEAGQVIKLTVGDAPWATPDRVAFSTDNETWSQTEPGTRQGRTITYRHKVDAGSCWFAWGPPFTPADAQQLVDSAAKESPHAESFQLCRTRAGRAVPALHVREDNPDLPDGQRHGIWIQARQHAWESGSSWVAQGFVRWLTSDDDRAVLLRRSADIYIVPIMDVDNVFVGAGGKNQKPHDHNRDWSDQPHWNAVREAQRRISALNAEDRFDLFIDLHNPGAGSKAPFFYIAPRKLLAEAGKQNLDRFLASARLDMTGPLAFKGHTQESGENYDRKWRRISKNWVTFNTSDHVVSVTLETAWNTPHSTPEGYQRVGSDLGRAIERYFRTEAAAE